MPPWLQEQIAKLQQSQQNLQTIMTQRHQLELEKIEIAKALEELGKITDDETVFKNVGAVLIRSTKEKMIQDLEERQTIAKTQSTVLEKQESRIKENLKEQEAKITEMMKSGTTGTRDKDASTDNPRR